MLDCEHFFDGYEGVNPAYAMAWRSRRLMTKARAGSCLADTNGGSCRMKWKKIVGEVCKIIPGDHVGIHAHNDTEQAVANSFVLRCGAGARQIQGTLNGLGERCGNANLVSIIPTLKLKPEYAGKFDIGVSDDKLNTLADVPHALDEMCSTARRTVMHRMSAKALQPPRPASMPRRSSKSRRTLE